jgi:hypothetical protein
MEQGSESIEQGAASTLIIYVGLRFQVSVSNISLL